MGFRDPELLDFFSPSVKGVFRVGRTVLGILIFIQFEKSQADKPKQKQPPPEEGVWNSAGSMFRIESNRGSGLREVGFREEV